MKQLKKRRKKIKLFQLMSNLLTTLYHIRQNKIRGNDLGHKSPWIKCLVNFQKDWENLKVNY